MIYTAQAAGGTPSEGIIFRGAPHARGVPRGTKIRRCARAGSATPRRRRVTLPVVAAASQAGGLFSRELPTRGAYPVARKYAGVLARGLPPRVLRTAGGTPAASEIPSWAPGF